MLRHLDNLIKNLDDSFHFYMEKSGLDDEAQVNLITSALVNFMAMHLCHVEEIMLAEEQPEHWRHKTVEKIAEQIYTMWMVNLRPNKAIMTDKVLT